VCGAEGSEKVLIFWPREAELGALLDPNGWHAYVHLCAACAAEAKRDPRRLDEALRRAGNTIGEPGN